MDHKGLRPLINPGGFRQSQAARSAGGLTVPKRPKALGTCNPRMTPFPSDCLPHLYAALIDLPFPEFGLVVLNGCPFQTAPIRGTNRIGRFLHPLPIRFRLIAQESPAGTHAHPIGKPLLAGPLIAVRFQYGFALSNHTHNSNGHIMVPVQ